MAKRKQKSLVIDTDIAKSAGEDKAIKQRSINCRNVLDIMKAKKFKVVMSTETYAEWDKRDERGKLIRVSGYAHTWLTQMVGSKQIVFLGDVHNEEFREKMRNMVEEEPFSEDEKKNRLEKIEKDCHLLEAALATDKIVFSCDENTARKLFRQAAVTVAEIRPILWANPDLPEDDGVAWLQRGAPNEAKRRLDYIRQNPK